MSSENEETVIGVHESGILLEEGLNTSYSRNYCTNCRRKTHCFVKIDRETKEAIIHKTCNNDTCECKCRTHFACKKCGHLHPYGQKCNYSQINTSERNPEDEERFQEIMENWRNLKK